jgi:hypothetical protein
VASEAMDLVAWTRAEIAQECRGEYARFERELREHYIDYLERNSDVRGEPATGR